MEFNYLVKINALAQHNISNTFEYIATQLCNSKAATDLYEKIMQNIDNVSNFPYSAPLSNNEYFKELQIRKLIIDNYVLYYVVNEQKKEVIFVNFKYAKSNLINIL